MAKILWFCNHLKDVFLKNSITETEFLKPLGGSKVKSAIHTSEVDKMRTSDFWELRGKK